MDFTLPKLTKKDYVAIGIFIVFVILMANLIYKDKAGCEVARPGYECASAKDVMIEHCEYWAEWECDSAQDVSLPQVEWYIENMCNLYRNKHDSSLDCSNLKFACNTISGEALC